MLGRGHPGAGDWATTTDGDYDAPARHALDAARDAVEARAHPRLQGGRGGERRKSESESVRACAREGKSVREGGVVSCSLYFFFFSSHFFLGTTHHASLRDGDDAQRGGDGRGGQRWALHLSLSDGSSSSWTLLPCTSVAVLVLFANFRKHFATPFFYPAVLPPDCGAGASKCHSIG
jgi:hypothetical protein